MEELQTASKKTQLQAQLRAKRKAFNNKRFHTMPSDSRQVQQQNPSKPMHSLTQRSSKNVIKQAINLSFNPKPKKVGQKKIAKLQHFWHITNSQQGLKTCRVGCQGYERRRARVENNNQTIGFFFKDSTRFDNDKQNLHKNIATISNALRNSFPKLQLDDFRTDQSLRMSKQEYRNIFSTRFKSRLP